MTKDNNCYVKLTIHDFVIQDLTIMAILEVRQCKYMLYVMDCNHQAFVSSLL